MTETIGVTLEIFYAVWYGILLGVSPSLIRTGEIAKLIQKRYEIRDYDPEIRFIMIENTSS